MEARVVEAGRGWQWIVGGFALFRMNPLVWVSLTVILVLMWMISLMIPMIGPLLFNLFSPALFAGLMVGCKALESGGQLELAHLFAGFRKSASPLVTIGGVYLVGTIVVVGIVFLVAGDSMLPAVMSKSPPDMEAMAAALRSMALGLTIGLAFYIPLLMMIWFAPLLIVFHDQPPVAAMQLSFRACWINMQPFLVYGLAILVLWFIASIPLLLGLVILLPVLICSAYTSYKDVFSLGAAPAAGGNPLLK